tara:strand:+ start:922 stop:1794 length:873 start_codon:yes stop_codon:yes gene_type:complete
MQKILLTTDFSDNAWNAIVYALEFFKNEACFFYILHTYTPSFYRVDYMMGGPSFSAIPDIGVAIALAGLDKTLANIKKKHPNKKHQYKTVSAFNILTDEVREMTAKENIDLIVMGTQGATGAKKIFLGTDTVHVIRKSKIPVLAIPNSYKFKEIESILFPSDFSIPFQKEELKLLIDIAILQKASLKILNVKDDYQLTDAQKINKKLLATNFDTIDHSFAQIRGKLMPDAIHEYTEQHPTTGLLAMMSHKHSFLERLIVKSNIDTIGYHTTIPFLVIPYTPEEQIKKSKS